MGINVKCPKCGGTQVQLSSETSKHGCLFTVLFGIWYIMWVCIRWCVGACILVCYDWWMAIIKKRDNRGYVWQSKRWFSNRRKIYYCHSCGYNFRA